MAKMYRKPLHLSLASMQLQDLNLKNEVRMLKTALIYGDKVDIRSVASSIIMMSLFALGYPEQEIYAMHPTDPEFAKELIETAKEFRQYEGVQEFLDILAYHHDIVAITLFSGEGWGPELGLPEPNLEQSMIFDFMMQLEKISFL